MSNSPAELRWLIVKKSELCIGDGAIADWFCRRIHRRSIADIIKLKTTF